MGLNADSWRMKPQISARSTREAAGRLPRRQRIHRAVIALDVVALVPVGVADADRQAGQRGLLGERQHRLDEVRIGVDRGGEQLAFGRRHGAELQQGQRAAAGAVVAQQLGPARSSAGTFQSGSMRMPSAFCAIRP